MSDNEIREEEFATVEIRTRASPVHGILKNKSGSTPSSEQKSTKKTRHIYWDEKNLEECEAGKDSTMKITEPKTPYNRDYNSDDDKDDDEESGSESEQRDISAAHDAITQALLKISEDRENGIESEEEEEEQPKSEEEKKREHEAFEKKRKMHYNEFLEVKKFRERMAQGFVDDDDDDDDDDKDDMPPPPYSE